MRSQFKIEKCLMTKRGASFNATLYQNVLQLPVHSVLQVGRTVMVTSTGLDSFPPQSVATTDRT